MAVGDIYQLVFNHTVLGVACVNRFWYRQDVAGSVSGAVSAASSFNLSLVPAFAAAQSDDCVYQSIEVVNYRTPTDFTVMTPTVTTGTRTPTTFTLPPELVAKLKFNRNGPGTRYTFKAISGFLREDIDNSGLTAAATTIANNLGIVLDNALTWSGATFSQVQVQGPTTLGVNPTAFFVVNQYLAAAFGTQNTRKQ